ncbi:conjugal transfer protein TraG [Dankookia rubra]|uniref:Conjugal transfer protein TraG n=1 Tax=Dankookia rubra TaxID=1442381 RepID=A0A4R5QHY4_9PROT|nr:type IV secretion system DNA-binding domain-containing protein [Dankookia rubra]TDH62388.1 conjugal transfer protein TraG [Dankookia rubra]
MATVRRDIYGPDAAAERSAADVYQPVRSTGESFRQALMGGGSVVLLAAAAVAVAAESAIVAGVIPAACAYAWAVLRRSVRLPLRMPLSSGMPDYNDPLPGSRKPRKAAGIIYLGIDHTTGRELWISDDDGRQHVSVPGVTGAGKTTTLLGLCANSLAMGSGFVFVDGKGDTGLYADVYRLARVFGREKDVRVINLLVASGARDSHTFNPFAWASADAIREMLISQIEHNPEGGGDNKVFMQRAAALLGANAPVLVWMRDHHNVSIDIDSIRFATELQSVADLAFERRFRRRDPVSGEIDHIDVPDMPEALVAPLRSYLGDTGGYDMEMHLNKRPRDKASEQHAYVTMHFSATFTQLGVSLGHIFRCQISGVDMRDVAINRRILVVSLPALENSGETTAALGKLIVASIRNMMAQTLGGRLEGRHGDIIANKPTTAPTPYPIVYDELAAYVSVGTKEQLQQGRSLGFMFVLGWHDVAGLRAKIGDVTYSLLNNANLQIVLRQNEGGLNRQHIEQTLGEAEVTQTASYRAEGVGFLPAQSAEVRRTARVDWRDARGLIPGEGIITLANNRVHAKLFTAVLPRPGNNDLYRVNRPVPLMPPEPSAARGLADRIAKVRAALECGGNPAADPPVSAVLKAAREGFATSIAAGFDLAVAADAAINAVGAVPAEEPSPTPAPTSGAPPETEFTPTLHAVATAPTEDEGEQAHLAHLGREVEAFLETISAIEHSIGRAPEEAEQEARRSIALRDDGLESATLPKPPAIHPERLRDVLDALMEDLADD